MAWVEKCGAKTWRVRYFADDGRIGSVPGFSSKTAADHYAADLEAGQRAGAFIDPAAGRMTVAAWAADWFPSLDVDVRTEEAYESLLRRHIVARWGQSALCDISGIQVAGWAKQLRDGGLAPATVSGIVKLFTMMLADAVYERLIAYNPIQPRRRGRGRTARPAERVWATPDEVLAVADNAADIYGPGGAILILTAAWTGARWGELVGLHRRNLHLETGKLIVDPDLGSLHEGATGKQWLGLPKTAASARTIALPGFLIPLLEQHLSTVESEFVFVTAEGTWHRRSNFARRAMRPAADHTHTPIGQDPPAVRKCEPAKPGLTFHGLRHSHKAWMIADGVPEIAQSRRLGHVLHEKIQETYSHVAAEVEQRLLDGLQDRWEKAIANSPPAVPENGYRVNQ